MTSNPEEQRVIDGLWATLTPPPITKPELERAARKLWRYALCETFTGRIDLGRTNRSGYTVKMFQYSQLVLNDPAVTIGMSKGASWPTLVHCMAYWLARKENNDQYTHVELLMVREVLKRGWLDGRLADKLIPPAPKDVRLLRAREAKIKALTKRIASWSSKAKRANNALKKLNVQLRRMEKRK